MRFFLGAHHPDWLAKTDVPLFVSRRSLIKRKNLPIATCDWALDSGGFTELSLSGKWTMNARQYASEVRRLRDGIGRMAWAAPQDWMCEPAMVRRTGLTIEKHQELTVQNYLALRDIDPSLPIIPVLQGWSVGDYWHHVDAYIDAGVPLFTLPLVGIGTVCRRQQTTSAQANITILKQSGIKLHGFGLKTTGLLAVGQHLTSADSLAWSLNARKNAPLLGCTHKKCNNCLLYALEWRKDLLERLGSSGAKYPTTHHQSWLVEAQNV